MRKLSDLIILIRGGGEAGSAIAHKLARSHFRVCITELATPMAISRGSSYSEAVFDSTKTIEEMTAERSQLSLEHIYKVWRNGNIPVVVDLELTVKALIKPDVLINAMMLKRETNTKITDAPLVIGIGPWFTVGTNVHLVVESSNNNNLGKVLIEGEAEQCEEKPSEEAGIVREKTVLAEDSGVFTTDRIIGDTVLAGDEVGKLNETSLSAPISGVVRGILRSETKVLTNAKLFKIDGDHDKSICFTIPANMRTIAGGVLEAIMMSLNLNDPN
jgi:xanthine dehydrogenase accessory factor